MNNSSLLLLKLYEFSAFLTLKSHLLENLQQLPLHSFALSFGLTFRLFSMPFPIVAGGWEAGGGIRGYYDLLHTVT